MSLTRSHFLWEWSCVLCLHASGDSWIAGFHGTTGQLAGKPGTCTFPSVTSLSLKTTRCVTVGWKVSERLHATLWENTWKETRCCWRNGNLYHTQNIYFPRSGNTRACLYRVFPLLLIFILLLVNSNSRYSPKGRETDTSIWLGGGGTSAKPFWKLNWSHVSRATGFFFNNVWLNNFTSRSLFSEPKR